MYHLLPPKAILVYTWINYNQSCINYTHETVPVCVILTQVRILNSMRYKVLLNRETQCVIPKYWSDIKCVCYYLDLVISCAWLSGSFNMLHYTNNYWWPLCLWIPKKSHKSTAIKSQMTSVVRNLVVLLICFTIPTTPDVHCEF